MIKIKDIKKSFNLKNFKNKSNVRKISIFLVSLFLITSVVTMIAILVSESQTVKVSSTSNGKDEIVKNISASKYFNSLFKKDKQQNIIFDKESIKVNINKVLIDTISNLDSFKNTKYKKDDVRVKTKIYLESNKKLLVNTSYQFSEKSKLKESNFCIELN